MQRIPSQPKIRRECARRPQECVHQKGGMLVHNVGWPLDGFIRDASNSPLSGPCTSFFVRFPLGAGNARAVILSRSGLGDLGLRYTIKNVPLSEGIIAFISALLHHLPPDARAGKSVLSSKPGRWSIFEPRKELQKRLFAGCGFFDAGLLLSRRGQEVEGWKVVEVAPSKLPPPEIEDQEGILEGVRRNAGRRPIVHIVQDSPPYAVGSYRALALREVAQPLCRFPPRSRGRRGLGRAGGLLSGGMRPLVTDTVGTARVLSEFLPRKSRQGGKFVLDLLHASPILSIGGHLIYSIGVREAVERHGGQQASLPGQGASAHQTAWVPPDSLPVSSSPWS